MLVGPARVRRRTRRPQRRRPALWLLQTQWQGPGAYRRALSAYDVKMRAWSLLGQAVDEPSAYEILRPGEESNRAEPRQNP